MCLQLVKQLDSIERLPINHTIFTHLTEKDKKQAAKANLSPLIGNPQEHLFSEFERSQKEAHLRDRPPRVDPDSGLMFCVFHPDRVEHFFCTTHHSAGCRVCSEVGHSKPTCKVVDLY